MSEVENQNEIEIGGDTKGRVYELGYLLVPTISAEDVPASYGNLKELVLSLGGEAIADDMPQMINLAYQMAKVVSNVRTKFNTAYFGWLKFAMDSDKVLELKKKLDLDPTMLRFLIMKTVRENTVAAKRFVRPEMHRRPTTKKNENETALPINKEEIDKEIDALIAA